MRPHTEVSEIDSELKWQQCPRLARHVLKLNPTEHVWDEHSRRGHNRQNPQELGMTLLEGWLNILQRTIWTI